MAQARRICWKPSKQLIQRGRHFQRFRFAFDAGFFGFRAGKILDRKQTLVIRLGQTVEYPRIVDGALLQRFDNLSGGRLPNVNVRSVWVEHFHLLLPVAQKNEMRVVEREPQVRDTLAQLQGCLRRPGAGFAVGLDMQADARIRCDAHQRIEGLDGEIQRTLRAKVGVDRSGKKKDTAETRLAGKSRQALEMCLCLAAHGGIRCVKRRSEVQCETLIKG